MPERYCFLLFEVSSGLGLCFAITILNTVAAVAITITLSQTY